MIDVIRETPAWLLAHPVYTSLIIIGGLAAFTSLILLNPEGRQVRNLWKRKR